MKTYKLNTNSNFEEKDINLTIGNFDGVHLGHQHIIDNLIKISKENNYQSCLLSFLPHPRRFFGNLNENFNIVSDEYKKKILNKLGLNIYIDFEFNSSLAALSPESFIKKILCEKLNIKSIIVGEDFKYGKDRKGDLELLKSKSTELLYDLKIIKSVLDKNNNQKYSSSIIRENLKKGKLELVNEALGRNWSMTGKVIAGDMRARKIHFPTANCEPGQHILPLKGVYNVYAILEGNKYKGVANFGERPTIDGKKILLETHIFDFDEDIYGKELTVEFLTFIRHEQKFDNFQKLTEQINKDIKTARDYHKI